MESYSESFERSFEKLGGVFNDLLRVYYCEYDKNNKPVLVLQFPKNHDRALQESLSALLSECGGYIIDKKHRAIDVGDNVNVAIMISGYNGVLEALRAILIHEDLPAYDFLFKKRNKNEFKKKLTDTLNNIINRKNASYKKDNKSYATRKDLSHNKLFDEMEMDHENLIAYSSHEVDRQLTPKNKIVYNKPQAGAISEIASFNSDIYSLLLGFEQVGKTRAAHDAVGLRTGSISKEIPGYVSLKSYIYENNLMKNIKKLEKILISGGMGKVETANHVYAENDAHWNNVGINKKNKITRIDFDQSLFDLTCIYLGINPDKKRDIRNSFVTTKEAFQVNRVDIIELPNTTYTKPKNAMKYHLDKKLLDSMEKDSTFINDKWSTYLKYLLINDDIYQARLNYHISSTKRKNEILGYLRDRRNAFKTELLSIPEFRNYIGANPSVFKTIINEFNELNKKYHKNPRKKSMIIDTDLVTQQYLELSNFIREDYIIHLSYPNSYKHLWNDQQSLSDNIQNVMNDYIYPKGGTFLSGHWSRNNVSLAQDIIVWLKGHPEASQEALKNFLNDRINETILMTDINNEGSYVKRLEFCLKKIVTMELQATSNPRNTQYT